MKPEVKEIKKIVMSKPVQKDITTLRDLIDFRLKCMEEGKTEMVNELTEKIDKLIGSTNKKLNGKLNEVL